ncbi:MAG: hypothetical protein KAV01_00530 [Candidatus Lokiarchaeota archaeon]|nr:hypothetical protein [Candidatus Lokiarchaeota archaeon]
MSIHPVLLIQKILNFIETRFAGNLISVYGIGSYFEDTLPPNWMKNDIDIVIFVESITKIPKEEWKQRFKPKKFNGYDVWFLFNTIEGFQDKEEFKKISEGANYEWSLIELKLPENSKFLYGLDIRNKLPDITNIQFDYDDILARALYHLEICLKQLTNRKDKAKVSAMKEFTKAVFKFSFYICIFYDSTFHFTSNHNIERKIFELVESKKFDELGYYFLTESIHFRKEQEFNEPFKHLLRKFTEYIFNLLGNGKLHRPMKYQELRKYLEKIFRGLPYLIRVLDNAKQLYNSKDI